MAVAFDGFSIRAYAAKMRNADVAKRWPFKEESEDLPPMAVPKFRWWSNELAELRRRQTSDAAAPVELFRSPLKAKLRPTKKRSIAEIFAVAPQIDPVDHEIYIDEVDFGADRVPISDSGDYLSELRNGIKKNRNENNMKRFINKKKKKKKKKRTLDHHGSIIAIKKSSPSKLKHQNHASFAKRVKRFAMDMLDSDLTPRKKTSDNPSSIKENEKADNSPILISTDDDEESAPPVRSILKNHQICEPNSTTGNVNCIGGDDDDDEIPCGTQSSEKHVKFSEETDVLHPDVGSSSLSDCLGASSPENLKAVAMEVDGSVDEIEVEPVIIELPCSPVLSVPVQESPSCLPEKTAGNYYDKKLQMLDENPSVPPGFASRLFSTAERSRAADTDVGGSVIRIPGSKNARLTNHAQDPIYTVEEVNPLLDCTSGLVEPVSLTPAGNNGGAESHTNQSPLRQVSDPMNKARGLFKPVSLLPACSCGAESPKIQSQLPHNEQLSNSILDRTCRLFEPVSLIPASVNEHLASCIRLDRHPNPKDLIGGSNSLPRKQAVVSRKMSSIKDFVGSLSDSQGIAIQSNPRPAVIGSSTSLLHAQSHTQPRGTRESLGGKNDREDVFVAENHARESQNFHMPARLGVTSSSCWESYDRGDSSNDNTQRIGLERINLDLRPLDTDLIPQIIYFDGTRPLMHGRPKKNSGNNLSLNACQPTMRLMGKDVPIGSDKVPRSDDGKGNVWTDKQIIIEDCDTEEDSPAVPTVAPNFREWIPVEKQSQVQKVNGDHLTIQSNFEVKPVSLRNSNNTSFASLPASSAPRFRDFFVSEGEPVPLLPQHQIHDPYADLQWRPAELTYEINFSNHNNSNSTQLPSWLVQAKQQGKTQANFSHLHHQVQPQQISSRTNIFNTPSLYQSQSNPLRGVVSNFPNVAQVSRPGSNTSYVNRVKQTEKVNPKPLGINDIYPWKRTAANTATHTKNLAAVKLSAGLTTPTRPAIVNMERDRTATMRSSGVVQVNQGINSDVVFPVHQTIPFIPPAGSVISRVNHQDSRNNTTNINTYK